MKDMQGWKATHKEHKVGMRAAIPVRWPFENCRIPATQILGEEGKGLRVTMAAIGDVGRGGMVGAALGFRLPVWKNLSNLPMKEFFTANRLLPCRPFKTNWRT